LQLEIKPAAGLIENMALMEFYDGNKHYMPDGRPKEKANGIECEKLTACGRIDRRERGKMSAD
jgi:hypothetical protein